MGTKAYLFLVIALASSLYKMPPPAGVPQFTRVKNDEVKRVLKAASIANGEVLLIFFGALGECQKCTMSAAATVECVATKTHRVVKCLGIVRCSRDIELPEYRREFGWTYPAVRELDSTRALLGLSANVRYALLDSNGNLLGFVTEKDFLNQDCEHLAAILQK